MSKQSKPLCECGIRLSGAGQEALKNSTIGGFIQVTMATPLHLRGRINESLIFDGDGLSQNISCAERRTCIACINYDTDVTECLWCGVPTGTTDGLCLDRPTAEESCRAGGLVDTCTGNVASYVVVLVLSALLCCCCGLAMLRKFVTVWQSRRQWPDGELARPLLGDEEEQAPETVFRNSLTEAGETPWICPVCWFDNRPRCKNCDLCGTSKDFAEAYDLEKRTKGTASQRRTGGKAMKVVSTDEVNQEGQGSVVRVQVGMDT
ncbi:unnamed protein product, partial [Discosporangium mesarthrocarpum]